MCFCQFYGGLEEWHSDELVAFSRPALRSGMVMKLQRNSWRPVPDLVGSHRSWSDVHAVDISDHMISLQQSHSKGATPESCCEGRFCHILVVGELG